MTDSYQYGQFSPEHLTKIAVGIKLYNQQKFWECHEELEEHWIDDIADNARLVYWAVIQVATSLYHLEDDNMAGAEGMLNKAKDKFRRCKDKSVETELLESKLSWSEFKCLVFEVPDQNPSKQDFEKLSNFRFQDPEEWTV